MKISCRICKVQKGEFFTLDSIVSIYGKKEYTLLDVYNKCLQLNAILHDALPQVVCLACFGTLKEFFEFQLKAKKSDQELRGNLPETSTQDGEFEYLENYNVSKLHATNLEKEIKTEIDSIKTEDESDYIEENYETDNSGEEKAEEEAEDTDILFELYSKNDSCVEKYLKLEKQYSDEIIVKENDGEDSNEVTSFPPKNNDLSLNTDPYNEFVAEEKDDDKDDIHSSLSDNKTVPLNTNHCDEFGSSLESALPSVEISRIELQSTQVKTVVLEPLVEIRKCQCSDCGRKYLTEQKLEEHHKMHTQLENCQCKICGLILQSLYDYSTHMKGHATERKFSCEFCDKAFSTRANLKTHLLIHTNLRPFKCEICGKSFQQKSILKTHMTLHTGKPFECTLCHRRFSRTAHLNIHMRQHNNIRPYQCPQCPSSYMQKSHLDRHISSSHLGVRFQCTLCSKMYTKKPSLNTHMREAHCGSLSTYNCDICDLDFSKQKGLYYHLKSKHPDYRRN